MRKNDKLVAGRLPSLGLGLLLVFIINGLRGLLGKPEQHRDVAAGAGKEDDKAKESSANPHAAAREPGRGREADSPAEIPALGWRDIAWRVYGEIGKDRVLAVAAGVTFYGLLAVFPAIAAFVSLYGIFADVGTINDHLAQVAAFLPGGAVDIIGDQVRRVTSKGDGTLGLAMLVGVGLSLWSANAGMKAIFDALNVAYGEEEKRNFVWLNLWSLAFTVAAILLLLVAVGAVVVVPIVLEMTGLGPAIEWIVWAGRWPALLLLLLVGLAALYRYGPSRDRARWLWLTPGAIFAAVGWIVFSMAFSWYVGSFGSYNETYGSLGAAIGFMTWMWLSATIIMVGAEINAEIEHQTARDTTEGPTEPLGVRGARMADAVGEAQ
jgi:membrane protein